MLNISKLTDRKYKIFYVAIYFIYSALYIASPIMIMEFIDSVSNKDSDRMMVYSIICISFFLLIQIFSYIFSLMVGKVESNNFVNYFTKLDFALKELDFKESSPTKEDLNQLIGQNYEIANPYFFIKPVELIFSVLNIIAIFVVMFMLNWTIALILLVFVPISFLVTKLFEKKLYKYSDQNLNNMKNIKSFIMDDFVLSKEERFLEQKQMNRFDLFLGRYIDTHKKQNKVKSAYLYFFVYCFLNLAILIVILMTGYLTYKEVVSIGVLFSFQNYTSQLWQPCEFLMSYASDYQQAKPALDTINDSLNSKTAHYSHDKIRSISLKDVSLLDNERKPINSPLNCELKSNMTYIIKGENGVGKTTLIETILGFTDRYNGEILINGSNEHSDDLVYVASNAYISPIYDENRACLSTGQKKLFQIELALKTDKSLYIFDEPTNFVDQDNKQAIISSIKRLKERNKMIIIVTHDSDLFELADEELAICRN